MIEAAVMSWGVRTGGGGYCSNLASATTCMERAAAVLISISFVCIGAYRCRAVGGSNGGVCWMPRGTWEAPLRLPLARHAPLIHRFQPSAYTCLVATALNYARRVGRGRGSLSLGSHSCMQWRSGMEGVEAVRRRAFQHGAQCRRMPKLFRIHGRRGFFNMNSRRRAALLCGGFFLSAAPNCGCGKTEPSAGAAAAGAQKIGAPRWVIHLLFSALLLHGKM
jgi:hypothetical protein